MPFGLCGVFILSGRLVGQLGDLLYWFSLFLFPFSPLLSSGEVVRRLLVERDRLVVVVMVGEVKICG